MLATAKKTHHRRQKTASAAKTTGHRAATMAIGPASTRVGMTASSIGEWFWHMTWRGRALPNDGVDGLAYRLARLGIGSAVGTFEEIHTLAATNGDDLAKRLILARRGRI